LDAADRTRGSGRRQLAKRPRGEPARYAAAAVDDGDAGPEFDQLHRELPTGGHCTQRDPDPAGMGAPHRALGGSGGESGSKKKAGAVIDEPISFVTFARTLSALVDVAPPASFESDARSPTRR
jgi:hypothetical protein